MEAAWGELHARLGDRLAFEAPLARLTTLGVGGPARVLARCDHVEELAAVLGISRVLGLPVFFLGLGSNVLFADSGFDGVVVRLGAGFRVIEAAGEGLIRAGAGAPCAALVAKSAGWALTGLECLAGIPSTVGGAVWMNAGSFGGEIGPAVARVDGLTESGSPLSLSAAELQFSYRRLLGLPPGAVITGVELALRAAPRREITDRIQDNLARRAARQPKGVRSAGSVFKNPPGDSAGRLIEECGFKGRRQGGAQVSEVHANFIINRGGARAADILGLIRDIRETVFTRKGITLEPEIKIVDPKGEAHGA